MLNKKGQGKCIPKKKKKKKVLYLFCERGDFMAQLCRETGQKLSQKHIIRKRFY